MSKFTKILRSLTLSLAAVASLGANAQFESIPGVSNADDTPFDSIHISLITSTPGPLNFEHYGHSMVRVEAKGIDLLFNYGIFNFREGNFVYRFVKGDATYRVAAYDFGYVTRGYENRRITAQVLRLTQEQARSIAMYLFDNIQPGKETYLYGFCYNNCATKPRDIIEHAYGGALHYRDPQRHESFRDIMHRFDKNYPWQSFGIDLALGALLDKPITYRESMFVPPILHEAFANATVDGQSIVSEEYTIVDGPEEGCVMPPTPLPLHPTAVMTYILALVAIITICDFRRRSHCRIIDSALFGTIAIGGCIITFLIFCSLHYATSPNYSILWMHPLCIIPAVAVWIKKARKALRIYHILNLVALAAAVVVALAGVQWFQPGFYLIIAASALRSISYIRNKQ